MKVFKENDLKLFNQIASLEEETLLKTLGTFLTKQYGDNCVIATNEYVVANVCWCSGFVPQATNVNIVETTIINTSIFFIQHSYILSF
jgi:hypothetical protein